MAVLFGQDEIDHGGRERTVDLFPMGKVNPAAISMKTGMTGATGLKISIVGSAGRHSLKNGHQHQSQRFAEIGDRAKVVLREDRMTAMEQCATQQRQQRQGQADPQSFAA